ncbi:hypothetical protein [Symmachiella dynata]|uniref:Uncharacterized protein n=1 Tax=Symmachiella dynata TaxID=2527995 RepID=A0A517ZW88_9PLAN|nr:hypothetical protein [Symmachiella dynata]QDT51096.1 hypothetical protein Pan258_51790 [Symmachiella dynata]QDU46773.1 hypothetical protein Mal52_52950 [Symmachiella dynata]
MDEKPKPSAATGRPFLSVHLKCCNVYQRIYPNAAGDAYAGWCPRCATAIRVPIVENGGSSTRFFTT